MRFIDLASFIVVLGLLVSSAKAQTSAVPNVPADRTAELGSDVDQGYSPSSATLSFSAVNPPPSVGENSAAKPATAQGDQAAPPEPPPADKPWTIPQLKALERLGILTTGWLEQGVTFNALSPHDGWNGPVATNDLSNNYELNQFWLTFVRPVKTDGCGFDVGGRIDACYGTDWRYGDSLGLESKIDAANGLYGLVIPQFYLEVGYDDLTVKMGHYAASMGYEQVPAPANFFYSHSHELAYAEIILATGFQADYKLSENWSVNGGINTGWGMFEDNNDKMSFLGGLKWHNTSDKTSVSFEITAGPSDPAGENHLYDYALVLKQQLSEKLLYVAQHNFGGAETATGGYGIWYGLDQYLIYTINPKLSAGARVEWFRDEEGTRVAGVGNLNDGWSGLPGFAGTFSEVTTGLNWRPCRNLVVRPELRWDWYGGTTNVAGQLPFGDGLHASQFLFATDAVFTF
jgi:hypothetical protein